MEVVHRLEGEAPDVEDIDAREDLDGARELSAASISAAARPRNAARLSTGTFARAMIASSCAAGTACSMATSAGSRARPSISPAAPARRSSRSAWNAGSTDAFLTRISIPRGMGPHARPLPGGRPPTIVVRTASRSAGRSFFLSCLLGEGIMMRASDGSGGAQGRG